jgi:hypothetical protein
MTPEPEPSLEAKAASASRSELVRWMSIADSDCYATVNAAWRTSMEVGVRVESENPRSGARRHNRLGERDEILHHRGQSTAATYAPDE